MPKILIIKLGALGDVVRTTPLLRALAGEIMWVTSKVALPLLENNHFLQQVYDIDQLPREAEKTKYDLVLCLDEGGRAADLASTLKKKELVGTYADGGGISYTDSAKEWFDMGLISRLGKKRADELKWNNRKSYQEILFGMFRKKFLGEEYILPESFRAAHTDWKNATVVGVEARAGERWIGKCWPHHDDFIELIHGNHSPEIVCRKFGDYKTIEEFARVIDEVDYAVTTDTLAMHLALGLRKPTLAIFTVTSPHEIYNYDRMEKIVSPLLEEHFYSTKPTTAPGLAIKPAAVYNNFLEIHNKKTRLA